MIATTRPEMSVSEPTVYVAFELGKKNGSWRSRRGSASRRGCGACRARRRRPRGGPTFTNRADRPLLTVVPQQRRRPLRGTNQPPSLSGGDRSIREDRLSTTQRPAHDAAEAFADIRRRLVPLLHLA